MSKNKLLNLDEFVPDTKSIRLDGTVHMMRELTVEEYVAKVKASKDVKEAEKMSLDEQIARTIEMVTEAFPTIPAQRLEKMSLQQLTIILDFILKAPEDIEREAQANSGNA